MTNVRIISLLFAILIVFILSAQVSAKQEKDESILVGVEYFNGWWEHSPNKWHRNGKDWRTRYPERIPLLGQYNNQETMNKEIDAAANHGVDFFSILWYYPENAKHKPYEFEACQWLNAGLEDFMQSPNAHKMKFMVELCNHEPFAIISDDDWKKSMDVCIKAMKHPSYLRIDGRSVLKIHGGEQFHADNDSSFKRSAKILKMLRKMAKNAGVGDLLITVGTYRIKPIDKKHNFSKIGQIDGTMQYMDVPELPQKETDYSYSELLDWSEKIRNVRKKDVLSWVPYSPAGWNPRPWGDPRASFSLPTRDEWKSGLITMKKDLLESDKLGFPKRNGKTQKAFTIYAWNEFGEGGILAPTQGDKYMKLEVIKEVFGK